ncbi:uncharacterized protein PHACADRAFT_251103 [Phanerochaete carnosa HHB-10118-sp]|uniref:Uncharacterized protein n=1 Tax=Phanerochaete carnosa (strain HHB-10118-sp) TaxID=650164 RepID=K5WEF5_PHACS|nr:uncharacterized protein PHACADRAFT_251103 [Phanerochaete carnosa HHB-10118-sp]EKM57444.1 hypothetical protein PHACADRAFT_251103 [Phanerochaete carnosa HHB-10118-sp]
MSTLRPALPSEVIHAIVSTTIARYVDDLIFGSLSTANTETEPIDQTSNPVTSLLAVSYQFRQVTLNVLSKAFALPLCKEGLWRLEQKPWTKIKSVRRSWTWGPTPESHRSQLAELLGRMGTPESPVLCVYLAIHAINQLALHQDLRSPALRGGHFGVIGILLLFRSELNHQYAKCPPAFQEVLFPRLEACSLRNDISRFYEASVKWIANTWNRLKQYAPYVVANEATVELLELFDSILRDATVMVFKVQDIDKLLLRSWSYSIPADTAIGVERLTTWHALFDEIANWDGPGASLPALQGAAKELRDNYRVRLDGLGAPQASHPDAQAIDAANQ